MLKYYNRILKNLLYGNKRKRNSHKKSKYVTWKAYYDLKRQVEILKRVKKDRYNPNHQMAKYDYKCK